MLNDWFNLLWVSANELGELADHAGCELAAIEPMGMLFAAELRPRGNSCAG